MDTVPAVTPDDALITVREAAEYLRVSERTLRKYIDAGTLPAKRLPGNQFRLRRSDVQRVLS